MKAIFYLVSSSFVICSFLSFYYPGEMTGIVTDIEGNSYSTVSINEQVWMSENLRVGRYRNGDLIPEQTSNNNWKYAKTGSWCYYENDSANGNTFGKLYNWRAINDPRGLCPKGWHVPAKEEFEKLITFMGGSKIAGAGLKADRLWKFPDTVINNSGFNALPGGARYYAGAFYYLGYFAGFWTSTEANKDFAWTYFLESSNSESTAQFFGKDCGFSCRCVKD